MKIKRLCIKNHPFLGTTEIDFTAPNGEPLNTVVLAGINGSWKTTLLYSIKNMLEQGKIGHKEFSTLPNIKNSEHITLTFTPIEARIMALMRKRHFDSPDATIEYGLKSYNPFEDYANAEDAPQTVLPKHPQPTELKIEQLFPAYIPSDKQFVERKPDIVKILPKSLVSGYKSNKNNWLESSNSSVL